MLLDTYEVDGVLSLCHGYCELGSTPLDAALGEIRTFLETHPDDVMAIVFEDHISAEQTAAAFADTGLDAFVYTWDGGPFPTFGEMAARGTRLVVTAESGGPPPAWYHHAWDVYVDTPYTFASIDAFSCDVNRGALDNPLFLLNHWVADPLPSAEQSGPANAYDVLYGRATECAATFGHLPNLVAVDWYTEGDLFAVVDALNAE
jgi:hypothetical protein